MEKLIRLAVFKGYSVSYFLRFVAILILLDALFLPKTIVSHLSFFVIITILIFLYISLMINLMTKSPPYKFNTFVAVFLLWGFIEYYHTKSFDVIYFFSILLLFFFIISFGFVDESRVYFRLITKMKFIDINEKLNFLLRAFEYKIDHKPDMELFTIANRIKRIANKTGNLNLAENFYVIAKGVLKSVRINSKLSNQLFYSSFKTKDLAKQLNQKT